jgi:DNA-binding NarL/FixJ family response regulator
MLATDSFLIGDGLTSLFTAVADIEVVGRARHHDELLTQAALLVPDVVIIGIRTPVVSTMATIVAARRLRAEHPDIGILVISDRGTGFAIELLRGGASKIAFLLDERLPNLETLLGALRSLWSGQSVLDPSIVDSLVQRGNGLAVEGLTLREVDVLEQMAHGLSNRAVATELHVSIKAVEKYITIIFKKLGLVDQSFVDRRVIAALTFLRSQENPFAQLLEEGEIRVPRDVDEALSNSPAPVRQAL